MPFHPQSDGASERSIPTVNSMLAKIVKEDQRNCALGRLTTTPGQELKLTKGKTVSCGWASKHVGAGV